MIVTLDPTLYLDDALAAAIDAFANHAAIRQEASDPTVTRITIDGDARTVDEFLNYALIISLERHLATP